LVNYYYGKIFGIQDAAEKETAFKAFIANQVTKATANVEKLIGMYSKAAGFSDGDSLTWADLLIYDFVSHNDLPHDKYLIIEWDTYCNCSIEDFFGDALNKETFGNIVHDPIQENWNWYTCLTNEQKSSISVFGGYTPTTGLLFSKELILKINQHLISNLRKYDNIFSELRLGSLAKIVGGSLDVPFKCSHKLCRIFGNGTYLTLCGVLMPLPCPFMPSPLYSCGSITMHLYPPFALMSQWRSPAISCWRAPVNRWRRYR
jgi:hypothetical protein